MTETGGRRAVQRLRSRKERHAERSKLYRAGFAAVGFLISALGVILVPLPGPGFLIMAVGLAMLALEFTWAERMLERTVDKIELAARTASDASPLQKALFALLAIAGAATLLAIVLLWDVPLLPV